MDKKILLLLFLLSVLILPNVALAAGVIVSVMNNVISATRVVAFALVIIFWIITGILFLIAQGAPEKLSAARKSLLWTTIGTALVILAEVAGIIIQNALNAGL